MTKSSIRLKLLNKIAQSTDIPDTEVKPASILPPPFFQFSSTYPTLRSGFNASSISIIDQLGIILNTALHYSSAGKTNLQIMKNNNFSTEPSSFPSQDTKSLIIFSKLVFTRLLNNGNSFDKPLLASQVHDIINLLINSSDLSNLSTLNPNDAASQKIQGNLKTNIVSVLTNLKTINIV
jgi:hypothetical protein